MTEPVSFDVERPPTFQRAHVFLRVALLIVIGWLGIHWAAVARPSRSGGDSRFAEGQSALPRRGWTRR